MAQSATSVFLAVMAMAYLCLPGGLVLAASKAEANLTLGNLETAAGAVAAVPVTGSWDGLAAEPSTLVLHAAWDADWVTLSGVSAGAALAGAGKAFDFEPKGKSVTIVIYGGQIPLPQADLVYLNFQVGAAVAAGTSVVVRNTGANASDAAGNAVSMSTSDGGLTVTKGPKPHSADYNGDWHISLSEVLRMVQIHNVGSSHCDSSTEDGFAPGPGDRSCAPHDSDYNPRDWAISISELLRIIQFYNTSDGSYHMQPGTEDGYAPGGAAVTP
jgi:hypothetical protein